MLTREIGKDSHLGTGPSKVTITETTNHYEYRVNGLEIPRQANLFQCGLIDMGVESTSEKCGLGVRVTWTGTAKAGTPKQGICDFLPRKPKVRN